MCFASESNGTYSYATSHVEVVISPDIYVKPFDIESELVMVLLFGVTALLLLVIITVYMWKKKITKKLP